MNMTRVVACTAVQWYLLNFQCCGNVPIIDFFYLSIAAILWAVSHLTSRLRTETKRAQNHNWKESGDHILEVRNVWPSNKDHSVITQGKFSFHTVVTQGKFFGNLQVTRQRLRPTLQRSNAYRRLLSLFLKIVFPLSDQLRDTPASLSLGPTMSLPTAR